MEGTIWVLFPTWVIFEYRGGYFEYNGGISWIPWGIFSTPTFSCSLPWGDAMIHVWGCSVPSHLSWYPPTAMNTPYGPQDIPTVLETSPTVLKIPSTVLKISLHGTDHTLHGVNCIGSKPWSYTWNALESFKYSFPKINLKSRPSQWLLIAVRCCYPFCNNIFFVQNKKLQCVHHCWQQMKVIIFVSFKTRSNQWLIVFIYFRKGESLSESNPNGKQPSRYLTWWSGYCYFNKGECNLNQSKHDSFVKWVGQER